MTDEKLKKATELKREIDTQNSFIGRLKDFLDRDKITEVKLATSQNSCLQYIISESDLKHIVDYLTQKHNIQLDELIKEYEEL